MKLIRVLLVDDHTLVRAGICALLQSVPGIKVVGEASSGQEALRLVTECRPVVILLDITMSDMNGLTAAEQLTAGHPWVRVIMLTGDSRQESVLAALRAGAVGYVTKSATPEELSTAVRTVVRGKTFLSSSVSEHVVAGYLQGVANRASAPDPLTPRQREVLRLIAAGMRNKDIARRLRLSVKTVEMHRTQLMKTLDIHDVAGLVRYAIGVGLASVGGPDEPPA